MSFCSSLQVVFVVSDLSRAAPAVRFARQPDYVGW